MGLAALSIVGTVVGAVGSVVGAMGQANAAAYQAQVAEQNRKIAEQNAVEASQAGQQELFAQGMKTRAAIGSAKSALAGAGVDVNTGTAAGLVDATAALGTLDSMTVRHNTAMDIRGWKTKGLEYQAQAQMKRMEGKNAVVAGIFNAGSSILGGASQVTSQRNRWDLASGTSANYGMGFRV